MFDVPSLAKIFVVNTVCNLHINQGYNTYNPKAYDIPDTEDIGWKI